MELVDCNIYQYNNSIEQELEPTEVDDLSGVSWPHSENEEIHQDLLQDVIKINRIDNSTNNTGTTERTYTTDLINLIRGEDIKISIDGHKPMIYFKFDKPFSFQSSSDHTIKCVGYCKLLTKITGCEFDTLYHIVDGTNLGIVIGCDFMMKSCMKIDYARHTISVTPFLFLYTIYSISVPAKSSVEVEASVERPHRDLTLITSPIKVLRILPQKELNVRKILLQLVETLLRLLLKMTLNKVL